MEKNEILKMPKRDFMYYYNQGQNYFMDKDFVSAIKKINRAITVDPKMTEILCSCFDYLMQCHKRLGHFKEGEFYLYLSAKNISFLEPALFSFFELKAVQEEDSASFYMDKMCKRKAFPEVMVMLKNFDTSAVKRKLIRPVQLSEVNQTQQINKLLGEKKLKEAISFCEKNDLFKIVEIRAKFVDYCFRNNKFNEAIYILENFGDLSVDIANLILAYDKVKNIEKVKETKKRIQNFQTQTSRDYFDFGIAYSRLKEPKLALTYMEKAMLDDTSFANELEVNFFYAIALMNDQQFLKAKDILIECKEFNPIDSFLYNYYINKCLNQKKQNYECINDLPVATKKNVFKTYEDCVSLGNNELLEKFRHEKDLFYYIYHLENCEITRLLLLHLADLDDKEIDLFFNVFFAKSEFDDELKNVICQKRISKFPIDSVNGYSLSTDDGKLTLIKLPRYSRTFKRTNPKLFNAMIECLRFYFSKRKWFFLNFSRLEKDIAKFLDPEKADEKFLNCLVTLFYSKRADADREYTLKDICSFFKISVDDFENFCKNNLYDNIHGSDEIVEEEKKTTKKE